MNLPPEVRQQIALEATPEALTRLCQSDQLYANICADPLFWKYKISLDYPMISQFINKGDYRDMYIKLYKGIPINIELYLSDIYPFYVIHSREVYLKFIDGSPFIAHSYNPVVATAARTASEQSSKRLFKLTDYDSSLGEQSFVVTRDGWAVINLTKSGGAIDLHKTPTGPILAYYPMWVPDPNAPFDPNVTPVRYEHSAVDDDLERRRLAGISLFD